MDTWAHRSLEYQRDPWHPNIRRCRLGLSPDLVSLVVRANCGQGKSIILIQVRNIADQQKFRVWIFPPIEDGYMQGGTLQVATGHCYC